MRLYRAFPYNSRAATEDPGGALLLSGGGTSRIDNPQLYHTLYAAFQPECAIAELFGAVAVWNAEMLVHANGDPYVVATIQIPDDPALWNMDDAKHLAMLRLKPSDVISRDREKTQAWAARVFAMRAYRGIRWWSYYTPLWTSSGLWDLSGAEVQGIERLSIDSPVLLLAAETIVRVISR